MDLTLDLLKELTEALGVAGSEAEVRGIIRRHVEDVAAIEHDNLGSIIARKEGDPNGPRVMVAAHMDEVGFMVSFVTEKGYLRFIPVGGWWEQVMLAQRVVVKTRKGDIPGIIGCKPPHVLPREESRTLVKRRQMFIDIGARDAEDAKRMGVRPGDPVVPWGPFQALNDGDVLMAKAWDDRAGCGVLIEALKRLEGEAHPNVVFGVGTVQEEVGIRGATTSARIVQPDVAFALDVDIATDTPGFKDSEYAEIALGKGPSVVLYDASMIGHVKLRDFVIDVAEDIGVALQFSTMENGGTDAGAIHIRASGVPSLAIGVPARYIHSHVGLIHRRDYADAVKLITEVIKRLDREAVQKIVGS